MVVTRVNTENGIRYSEDPTILAWEVRGHAGVCACVHGLIVIMNHDTTIDQTGNELNPPTEWTRAVAAFIKVRQ